MSDVTISLSPDLKRLRDEGFEVLVHHGFLGLSGVPYVNGAKEIQRGVIVCDLTLRGQKTAKPGDHQVWFAGETPCDQHGAPITALGAQPTQQTLCDGLTVDMRFSSKPKGGYSDYFEKMTAYADILSSYARAIDPSVTANTFRPIESKEESGVFRYMDTASSRAGISVIAEKLKTQRIAIVGLGGTGSYILDCLSKNPVSAIDIFDGDDYCQHNAFRSPGAASLATLQATLSKVEYFAMVYGEMHCGVTAHNIYIDDDNVDYLADFDFVFVCVDKALVRRLIATYLLEHGIPFIDVGMELELIEEYACIVGSCRVTLCTADQYEHFSDYVSLDDNEETDLYDSNIQIAEMNMLNGALAIIRWKKFCMFYQDHYQEHQTIYELNTHQLTRDVSQTPELEDDD